MFAAVISMASVQLLSIAQDNHSVIGPGVAWLRVFAVSEKIQTVRHHTQHHNVAMIIGSLSKDQEITRGVDCSLCHLFNILEELGLGCSRVTQQQ